MHCNKAWLIISSFALILFTGHVQAAVNCGISYYCYKSMTPTKGEQQQNRLVNRSPNANRSPQGQRLVRPPSTRGAANQAAQANRQTAQQAQQRAQQQRQAQQRAQQQRQAQQQRLAQQRAQQQRLVQQRAQQQRLAQQRAQQQRLAQQRAQQQRQAQNRPATTPVANTSTTNNRVANQSPNTTANNTNTPPNNITAANNRPALPEATVQSCNVLEQKIKELNRQAVLQSRNQAHEQAQRLFRIAGQLSKEAERKNCPPIT